MTQARALWHCGCRGAQRGAIARLGAIAALVAAIASPVGAQGGAAQDAAGDVQRASWIAGCWELRSGARVTHEQWMAPAGRAMLGMSRTTVRDTLREWEHLYLGPVADGVAYVARPSRQAETAFAAVTLSDTLLLFENPAHDFPQRIIYRRRGTDSLVARIEGMRAGQLRGVDFPMRRVTCAGG